MSVPIIYNFLIFPVYVESNFLLLARCVPNVAIGVYEINESKYILTTDRPTSHCGKFWMAISPQRAVLSTSCLVLG